MREKGALAVVHRTSLSVCLWTQNRGFGGRGGGGKKTTRGRGVKSKRPRRPAPRTKERTRPLLGRRSTPSSPRRTSPIERPLLLLFFVRQDAPAKEPVCTGWSSRFVWCASFGVGGFAPTFPSASDFCARGSASPALIHNFQHLSILSRAVGFAGADFFLMWARRLGALLAGSEPLCFLLLPGVGLRRRGHQKPQRRAPWSGGRSTRHAPRKKKDKPQLWNGPMDLFGKASKDVATMRVGRRCQSPQWPRH